MDVVERAVLDHITRIVGDALNCYETGSHILFGCHFETHLTLRRKPVDYNERTQIHTGVEGDVVRVELQQEEVDKYNRKFLQKVWYRIPLADPKLFDKVFGLINGHLGTSLVD